MAVSVQFLQRETTMAGIWSSRMLLATCWCTSAVVIRQMCLLLTVKLPRGKGTPS